MTNEIFAPLAAFGTGVSCYFKDLTTGETAELAADEPRLSASVIKLPVLVEAFFRFADGSVSRDEAFTVREEDKLPSCGCLNLLHTGIEVTARDLAALMITLSDNSATNMLIKRLGIDSVNRRMAALGLTGTRLNRLLFDAEAAARGLENRVTARDMAALLEKMYRGALVSPEADKEMLDILCAQRLNGKLPLPLPRGTEIAHKTGEDSGVTLDVGLFLTERPYILNVIGNGVYAPDFERALHAVSLAVYER